MPTLKELRESRGMSQRELAELIGVSRNTVARWEMAETADATNSIRPRGPAHKLLGIVFEVDPDVITYGAVIQAPAKESE